jgi:hypothetical protein
MADGAACEKEPDRPVVGRVLWKLWKALALQGADVLSGNVIGRQNRQHARSGQRGRFVYPDDPGVCMWRPHDVGEGHSLCRKIIDEVALPSQKPLVFDTPHRRADPSICVAVRALIQLHGPSE